jgi:hypothetical protein
MHKVVIVGSFGDFKSNCIGGFDTHELDVILNLYPDIPVEDMQIRVIGPYIPPNTIIKEIHYPERHKWITLSNFATNPYNGHIITSGNTTKGSNIISGINTDGILIGCAVEDNNDENNFKNLAIVKEILMDKVIVTENATSTTVGTTFAFDADEEFVLIFSTSKYSNF